MLPSRPLPADLRSYCLGLPGATAEFPFGPETLVFKVGGKIFALVLSQQLPLEINLKCDPLRADPLRSCFPAITPGYHMNKRHWNTVTIDGTIPEEVFFSLIDDSYRLVVAGLSRAKRCQLALDEGRHGCDC